ncbi:MAG: peptidase, partial [Planctomycetaceae bacterium]
YNRADFVIAEPGQSLYRWRDVTKLAVAVIDELPFHLEIVEPKVPLVRYGSMDLKIVARRKEGFVAPITVEFPFRPPGVGAASSVTIPQGQNEVTYPLSADGGAEIRKWPIYALGSADVGGAAWVSSQLATLEVADRYLQFAIDRADVEQGKQTDVFCKIQINKPFEGVAKVQLLGLPAKVTTTELDITKDTKELAFKVQTDPTSPAGTHKSIFCRVVLTENGEPVVHSYVGETELRIDQPLVKPAAPATPAAAPAAQPVAEAPPEKRLTRLEKLRLEAKKAAGGQ